MYAKRLVFAAFVSAAAASLSACSFPPKVLVGHNFNGDDKTTKMLIQDSGQIDPSTKQKLFDVFVRVCTLDAQGNESECKDTKVLPSVVPGSVY